MPFGTFFRLPAAALSLALLACGGSSPHSAAAAGPFSMDGPTVALEIGQSATCTVTIARSSSFTDAVSLSVAASTLPAGVKAAFSAASTTGTTGELSIQAGYPDPTDPTDATLILPVAGSYSITLTGASGTTTIHSTLHLTIGPDTPSFGLTWVDASDTQDEATILSLPKGAATTLNFAPYNLSTRASYPSGTTAALATSGLPAGLAATFGDNPAGLDFVTTVTLTPASTMADGTYTFYITGTLGSTVHYLPVEVDVTAATYWIQPPAAVQVAAGGTLTIPVGLGHNGTFFQELGGKDPAYLGTLALSAGSAQGLSASFDTPGTTALADANLTVDATQATPGTYTLPLTASRTSGATTTSSTSLAVTVTSGAGAYFLQDVEWGQTVLKSGLRLVPGKPAQLAARILADRPGLSAPVFTAAIRNSAGTTVDTLTLTGPATLPTAVDEGDLANAYTVTVPGGDLAAGMTVAIQGGTLAQTLTPAVEGTAYQLDLVVVPIVHKATAPVLPAQTDMATAIKAFWPVKAVAMSQRAPYTTSTVIAIPPDKGSNATDDSVYGWSELLDELTALRAVDGSTASYFGFIDLGLPGTWNGSSIVGLHLQGDGVGLGVDETSGAIFGPGQDVQTMVHELGHGFNLNHAPGGGANNPQLNYPYSGGSIGTWGYDPAAARLYAPSTYGDIMSYLDSLWVSDWNYLAAQNYIDSIGSRGATFVTSVGAAATRTLVSGWITLEGDIHLSPTEHVACAPMAPRPGTHQLTVERVSGTTAIQFGAAQVLDLPAGFRHFAFTVEGTGEIRSLDVGPARGATLRRTRRASVAERRAALEGKAGALTAVEAGRQLNLTWDAKANPYATVIHVGATTTTLAIRLTGGTASLPVDQLPRDGYFVVRLSDGLNPIEMKIER